MVVVKQLDPKYPRLGYEVQKGLMIDMPNGDGKADIVKNEDGSLTLSENEGKDTVTLKDVHLSDFVDHDVRLMLKHGFEEFNCMDTVNTSVILLIMGCFVL